MSVEQLVKTFPVIEIFGPVVQGEGPVAGQVTQFIRFGLCDYRCSWCDSMFAVDPVQVKQHATHLGVEAMLDRLSDLSGAPWVTLSGGNPAIHNLEELVHAIQEIGMSVCVETQGSIWSPWLADVDMLVVSPKPPSSGMMSVQHSRQTDRFMIRATSDMLPQNRAIKIVVFDQEDLTWADLFMTEWDWPELYLSVGTDPPEEGERLADTRWKVCERYRWLCEQIPYLGAEVAVYPQLHVLAYGHQRGV
jgi:7-carboxy-7-deazaguanine synthase